MPWNSARGRASSWLLTMRARLAAEFAGLVAVEQVGEAVQVLRDEEGDVLRGVGELDAPVHAELAGDGREGGAEGGLVEVGRRRWRTRRA